MSAGGTLHACSRPTSALSPGNNESAARWFASQPNWWAEHFGDAVRDADSSLHASGVTADKDLLDVGCGDGIISLGLLRNGDVRSVTGMDIVEVDEEFLNGSW